MIFHLYQESFTPFSNLFKKVKLLINDSSIIVTHAEIIEISHLFKKTVTKVLNQLEEGLIEQEGKLGSANKYMFTIPGSYHFQLDLLPVIEKGN